VKTVFKTGLDKCLLFILKRVSYFSKHHYEFDINVNNASLAASDNSKRKLLVVLGRECYFESVRIYPIGDLRALKKIIKNEPWRFPYRGRRLTRIDRLAGQAHQVTSWVIKQDVLDSFSNMPIWAVPETAYLAGRQTGDYVLFKRLSNIVCAVRTTDGLVSGIIPDESSAAGFAAIPSSMRSVIDYSSGHATGYLEGSQAVESILFGVFEALKESPSQYFMGFSRRDFGLFPWKVTFNLSAISAILYMLFSSTYLIAKDSWLDRELKDLRLEAKQPLDTRQLIRKNIALADRVSEVFAKVPPLWVAWDVFLDLQEAGVSYRAVNSSGSEVTFYANADKATDVLGVLSQDSRIESVDFVLPVRQVGGLEQFAISMTFDREIPLELVSNTKGTSETLMPYQVESQGLVFGESDSLR
tara:strand:+ start:2261 stop:3502 length:1242 start_codon:yes stop_codon:yes gene_type:complete